MAKTPPKRFAGDLGKRIEWTAPAIRPKKPDEFVHAYEKYLKHVRALENVAASNVFSEQARKLPLLVEHYGLKADDPKIFVPLLLLRVCRDFIPGFQVNRGGAKRGPKTTWDFQHNMQLIADVEEVKTAKKCGDRKACEILIAKKGPYHSKRRMSAASPATSGAATAARSLETRLHEARRTMKAHFTDLWGVLRGFPALMRLIQTMDIGE